MKERPILFSAAMVQAILSYRKIQTRRVLKTQPLKDSDSMNVGERALRCRYGQPGDQLWVKEAWRTYASLDQCKPSQIKHGAGVQYEAGGSNLYDGRDGLYETGRYRSSRFMPRWSSRITLEITDVRVERLQRISYEDALAEGMPDGARWIADDATSISGETPEQTARRLRWPQRWYETLWNEISGAGSWEINPWVWVIEFRRILE